MYNSVATGVTGSTMDPGFRPPWAAVQENAEFSDQIAVTPGRPQPEGGSNFTCGTVAGVVWFDGANSEAANAFASFMLQEEYILDLYFNIAKIQITPAFPEFITSDTYQNALDEELSDAWNRETVDTYQQDVEIKTRAHDTDPLNPIPGTSYVSPPMWRLQQEVLINDVSPQEAIDQIAPEHQSTIDEAQ